MLDFYSLSFKAWALGCVFLFFKMLTLSLVQGRIRFQTKSFTPPEDAKIFGAASGPKAAEPPLLSRANACWKNDLENIPIFLFVSLAYVLLGASGEWTAGLVFTFCLCRSLHSFFYLKQIQPWRTIAYNLATLVTVIMCLRILRAIFFNS